MHYDSVLHGFRLPLYLFIHEVCRNWDLLPEQFTANAHKYLASYILHCREKLRTPSARDFMHFFSPGGDSPFFSLYPNQKYVLFTKVEMRIKGCEDKFSVIEAPTDLPFDLPTKPRKIKLCRTPFSKGSQAEKAFEEMKDTGLIDHECLQNPKFFRQVGFYFLGNHPLISSDSAQVISPESDYHSAFAERIALVSFAKRRKEMSQAPEHGQVGPQGEQEHSQMAANMLQFLQQMAGAYVPPPPPPPPVVVVTIEKLKKNGAKEFRGDQIAEPMVAKHRLERVSRVLGTLRVPAEQRGDLAIAVLQDAAYDWWKRVGANVPEPVPWATFDELFRKEYVPEHFMEEKRDEHPTGLYSYFRNTST
ncbi:unnamed protein product [Cuscuta campestris]|uniref:Retrotransposon gag domain-containing protein n=1 Tax=Cuscuta campestris TaxID=132261 RepID=A0A484KSJ2_9ASTE|nr:unnamed protein product [Cuscuta campestris]